MAKKIVLFADGTGNAFAVQESNVWRLYQALDLTGPDQIAQYVQGVGTAGFRPFALLDGATGIGVPSNVRKLYRFLCWNWMADENGEFPEIYMFGFSRGAFTIRTLIALIANEGLMPRQINGETVSHAEMARNVRSAWRAYRAKCTGFVLPTIWITRLVRNLLLFLLRAAMGYRDYATVRTFMAPQHRDVRIRFAGLFDTVEAYGVPMEELRRAIDITLWPISFSNHRITNKVDVVRHALALDDERTSFHPLRFDMSEETTDRIKEIWFAGVHSDVGGGYPESTLAHVPLVWMAEEAMMGGTGVSFSPGDIDEFRENASALGPHHDSRAGTAVFYRYHPRPVLNDERGNWPIIHHSVVEKMVFGCDNYAPITLPENVTVLMPDRSTYPIVGFGGEKAPNAPPTPVEELAAMPPGYQAVVRLTVPNFPFVELARDAVWWRRVMYFVLLAAVGLTLSLPWTAAWLVKAFNKVGSAVAGKLGLAAWWQEFWHWSVGADKGIAVNLDSIIAQLSV
jgi:uncharacterized protein (DUF2235 family)